MLLRAELRGVDRVVARNAAIQKDFETELVQTLREQANETRREMRQAAPKFSGDLRNKMSVSVSKRHLTARVRARAPHASLVAHGRQPGKMPAWDVTKAARPASALKLIEFAEAHGIKPFLLARAIAKKGTKPKPFKEGPEERAKLAFPARVRAMVDRVVARHR